MYQNEALLKQKLADLYSKYHRREYLGTDPVEYVHRYPAEPLKQELVALFSSAFAYGNVVQIRASIERLLADLHGKSQGEWVRLAEDPPQTIFQGFKHRFHREEDARALMWLWGRSVREYGSLGDYFAAAAMNGLWEPTEGASAHAGAIERALVQGLFQWKQWMKESSIGRGKSFSHLLSSPADGSVCKRWCMFFRWMVRNDEIDPGTWRLGGVSELAGRVFHTSELLIPLDVHTARGAVELRLLPLRRARKTLGFREVRIVTEALRAVDPQDPIRFDFALCRYGMENSRVRGGAGRKRP